MIWWLSGLSAGHLRLQSAIGVPSGQVKNTCIPMSFRFFSIVEPSTGNPVMPARTSWTSARHRSTDWGHLQASCGIGRCPMICRLPADYKESANFKGHGPTPASGRSSWFVHDWLQIDVAAHPTNTFSYVWSVLHARSDQKSPDYAWHFCFIFSANLPSNVRYYPWNRGDRMTSF